MKKINQKEIKIRLLNILIELDKYCSQHGIYYYLCAGTLLGAVRHQGFIPWDDDIDVAIGRPQYDKLLELSRINDTFGGHYKIISFENGTSHYPFIKVLDTDTYTEQTFTDEENENSLWVDVFPFDGVPTNVNERKKLYRKELVVRKILNLNFAKMGKGQTKGRTFLKFLLIPLAKLYGVQRANNQIDKLCRSVDYSSSTLLGDIVWGDYNKEIVTKKEFEKYVFVTFEGHRFKTMACWDKYLKELYGNYMQLPPESQRQDHQLKVWIK